MTEPKIFVSYSWTSPSHEAWVLRLASDLRESGLDVILDKWDLKEGHDAHAFMERMVTDPGIKKVILVCDKSYVDKADGRKGGVGTEAQIISPEIYAKQAQDKFVAIATERNEKGQPYLPAYYRSRIYIDFSDEAAFSDNFEQLVRWAFDQPLHKKPPIGRKPAYLDVESKAAIVLSTSTRQRRAIDALKNSKDYALPAVIEYFDLLASEMERFRVKGDSDPFDDAIIENIEAFLPYRNEAIEIFTALAIYKDTQESRGVLHRFFESLIPYLERPSNITTYRDWDFDNFKFIIHELFLYALSCLVRHERFDSATYMMSTEYYVAGRSEYGRNAMVSFEVFRSYMKSLEYRNSRLTKNRLSLRADLLNERCKGVSVEFRQIMQTDFILFLRDRLHRGDAYGHWWPETLLYAERHSGAFEIFARSKSRSYFERIKCLLGIKQKSDLDALMAAFEKHPAEIPHWQHQSIWPAAMLGFDDLATKP